MAEIQSTESRRGKGFSKSKKRPIRVDLTPMVDLGFLLITFFIFTTAISRPTAMKLTMPDDRDLSKPMLVAESRTLNIILGADDKLCYYNGNDVKNMITSNYSDLGIRAVITNKRDEVRKKFGDSSQAIVLIKPTSQASYKNIVDALDEMAISNIKTYVLMDASTAESSGAQMLLKN